MIILINKLEWINQILICLEIRTKLDKINTYQLEIIMKNYKLTIEIRDLFKEIHAILRIKNFRGILIISKIKRNLQNLENKTRQLSRIMLNRIRLGCGKMVKLNKYNCVNLKMLG